MTRTLKLVPLTAEAFAPYGEVSEPPEPGERHAMGDGLGVTRDGTAISLSFSHPKPWALPLTAAEMEMHPWSSQTFVPLDVSRWVILVAPDRDGAPDPDGLMGFVATGSQAVNYRVGTWHHPVRVLDRPGRFATLMWTTGVKADDEVWSTLPEPVLLDD